MSLCTFAGELIYGVPNHGQLREMINYEEFDGRLVLVHRGKVHLQEKALNVQHSGAAGMIVVDDGQCDESFRRLSVLLLLFVL